MAHWKNDDRGQMLANKLAELLRMGCNVEILGSKNISDHGEYATAFHYIKSLSINLISVPESAKASIHSKLLLVSSKYGDNAEFKELVFTGSHNFTKDALSENDETLLKIDDSRVYNQYLDYWLYMKNQIKDSIDRERMCI